MKTILITGGSGFVGKNLVQGLQDAYNVLAPRHAELDLLDYDALYTYVKTNKVQAIVHAAVHVPMFNGAEKEFFNDMQMFANIEKVSHIVEKVLYFGSGAEFDKRYHINMVSEQDIGKTIPTSEYGLAKYTMNMLTKASSNIYNLRLFGVFGEGELWNIKFISNLCCKAMYDIPLTIRKDCAFDFLYVKDLVAITTWFLENTPKHHDYNVCMGKPYLLSELASMVKNVAEKNLDIQLLSNEKNLDYCANNARLCAEIPSLHITPMQEAITALYQYYQENKHTIDYETIKSST